MNKIAEFLSKWAFAIFLLLLAVALLFALACSIYTAVVNPFVGAVGCLGVVVVALATVVWGIVDEIRLG